MTKKRNCAKLPIDTLAAVAVAVAVLMQKVRTVLAVAHPEILKLTNAAFCQQTVF